MYLKGGSIQGAIYGGVSPRNYSGLKLWNRATDGVTLNNGNYVFNWKDISGSVTDGSRDWKPYDRVSQSYISGYGGIIGNSNNGLWIAGTTSPVFAIHDSSFKRILFDGTPITLIIIFRINSIQTNSGFPFFNTGLSTPTTGNFTISAPTNNSHGFTTRLNSNSGIEGTQLLGVYNGVKSYALAIKDYGYNAALPLLHRKYYVNNILQAEKKFIAAPNGATDYSPMILGCGAVANGIHEIIMYDNTGKDQQQIDFEYETLYTNYILKRYPNLLL